MKIVVAKMSGFCMGVRRAVEMVLDAPAKNPPPLCTFGPLIHNPQVLDVLASKGITALEEIPDRAEGTVLIRAHGVPPETRKRLKQAGFKVIDATCPRVIRVQSIIRKHARRNFAVVIVGDRDHPEVVGLLGHAGPNGYVVGTAEELADLPEFEKAILVAQTTQDTRMFRALKEWAARHYPHYKVFDTICDSTERRQADVEHLAESVDAVIVVGGRESGNTRRLYEIARQSGKPAFHVESEAELAAIDLGLLGAARSIGITAGASTPNWVIRKVYITLESMLFKRKSAWHRAGFTLLRTLLLTNLYVAMGAAGLCVAVTRLYGLGRYAPFVLISFLYVQSMHTLNHLTGGKGDRYNEPDRADFYARRKAGLILLALACGATGLIVAARQGALPLLILLVMSLLGLSYNLYLIPQRFAGILYRRIRDIPGSKTVLIAMAWGLVTSVLPPLALTGELRLVPLIVFFWSCGLVFCRTAFFDILDMQGDRLVGKETIAILLGEKKSLRLLKWTLTALTLGMPLLAGSGAVTGLGFLMALCPLCLLAIIFAYERGLILPGIRLEFLVESHVVLAGLLAILWAFPTR
jgi:4-hydroxy-3-methylbut-2-enyl diphosphate reductase